MYRILVSLAVLVPFALSVSWSASDEVAAWADARLGVRSGLELWLDAAQINSARKAEGLATLKSGAALAQWPDATGRPGALVASHDGSRPQLVQIDDNWVVRFDGKDDHLRKTGPEHEVAAVTAFIVAAAHADPGNFRAFLAANSPNRRDYETGFNIDMNAGLSFELDDLNVEGRGFGGAHNLLKKPIPFGTLQVIEAVVSPADKQVRLVMNGEHGGDRPFAPTPLSLAELTVGARYYTNGPGPQQVCGFLQGDIAEIILYNRVLTADETRHVREYLTKKHAKLRDALPRTLRLPGTLVDQGEPLVPVANPPPVQMLVPGFSVRALPVELTNINNVKYRRDGKLVALAYNGDIHLLSDTDGDGLEDTAQLFWKNEGQLRGPIGLALTPPDYPHGQGVFVPSKGKLSLFVDTDGDDRADKEIVIATGWKEISQNVDALGVALDKDGNIYFSLGTTNYANGYLIDEQGKSHFELQSERGTVQKVSPDFKRRETVCTGVRFPVALAFNRQGDLFCTDQEGATWLPNGNPLDELLHIQAGRHYGFPPRHPRHLPGVIDEPSVFDYGPQHQSTCGLNFNHSVNGGPTFGPESWAGDAIICGESRGKLYRTRLAKTHAGYIGQTQLFASLNMLTVDACVSPHGDLIVACHSGPPDWGTGPSGKGRLYKISYADRDHPQPVGIWAAGPQEVRIVFDRPLNPQHLKQLAAQCKITFGEYVRAGDRFESLFPPYAVVQMQRKTPRINLPVYSAQVTSDGRTLLLATAPMREAVHYALQLPGMGRPPLLSKANRLPQHPQIDLDFALSGVQAAWQPKPNPAGLRDLRGIPAATREAVQGYLDSLNVGWSGWLPHLDLAVAREFTTGCSTHQNLWNLLRSPGTLTLRTQLHLDNMLRPAIQPGARIDHEWPREKVTLVFQSNETLSVTPLGAKRFPFTSQVLEDGKRILVTVEPKPRTPIPVEISLKTAGSPVLTVSWHTAEDPRPRPLPLHRLLLPFAELEPTHLATKSAIPELEGGSWARGRQVFLSEEAACAKCHTLHGRGGQIGPDLSNVVHRDYASILRDLAEPSFAINPDYVTYKAALKDGRVLTGTLRTHQDQLHFGDEKGQSVVVRRAEVERMEPLTKSTMPDDLPKTLGPERMKDLLTYLLTDPPHMPLPPQSPGGAGGAPPPRPRADVLRVLAGAPEPAEKIRPIHVVLVAGKKDHGPGEHDYPAWQKVWTELLACAEQTKVSTAWEWPSAEELRIADVLVFFQRGSWSTEKAREIDGYLARGGGLVYVHWAVEAGDQAPAFAQRIGLASNGKIRFRHGPLDLGFETGGKHPIARNFRNVHFHDESYWKLIGDAKQVNVLAWSREDGEPQPQFWTLEPSKGRVFVSILGHFSWTFDDPLFRVLLLRGIAWTGREPVDRFNDLVWIGARVAE
jgi:putative heme-binding domain-containing protein